MMRRTTFALSLIISIGLLTAIGLAQNGSGSSSLVDRLTALRQSAEERPQAIERTTVRSGAAQRSTSGAGRSPAQRSGQAPRNSNAETARERTNLLDKLDPLNLFSRPKSSSETPRAADEDEDPAQPNAAPRRVTNWPATDRQVTSQIRRSIDTVVGTDRPKPSRPSPLSTREQEAPPTSTKVIREVGTAIGPSGTPSTRLPSLERSSSEVVAQITDRNTPTKVLITAGPEDAASPPADSEGVPSPASSPEEAEAPSQSARRSPLTASADRYASAAPAQTTVDVVLPAEEQVPPAVSEEQPTVADSPLATDPDASTASEEVTPIEAPSETSSNAEGPSQRLAESPRDAHTEESVPESSAGESSPIRTTTIVPAPDRLPGRATYSRRSPDTKHILSASSTPALQWQVLGPDQILIGREASFTIRLQNDNSQDAEHLVAHVEVPANVEILAADSRIGVTQRAGSDAMSNVFEWRVQRLSAHGQAELAVSLVPRVSQAIDLQISVRHEPQTAYASIDVLEPRLQVALDGPGDVLFGEPRTYRLTVSNPGTGPAENVVVAVTPPGEEKRSTERQTIARIEAGASKTLDFELTPRVAGDLSIEAVATADGGLEDTSARRILVRKPELIVDARGPRTTYAGTVATYYFRVHNPGDATADDVDVVARLPIGAEVIRASQERLHGQSKESISWRIGSLPAGEEFFMELKCVVNWAGENSVELTAQGADQHLEHSKSISTHVVALADLKLEITDPKGPIAVGREAVYEVRIRNRGSNSAEDVNVVAMFSDGVEPIAVEGGHHAIENGRVAFRAIENLPAGRDITFKIRATASYPGTHVFRAEVLCRELETKLAAEETTRFYLDETLAAGRPGEDRTASRAERFRARN